MTTQYKTLEETITQFNAEYDAKEAEFERSGKYIALGFLAFSWLSIVGLYALMTTLAN